MDLDEADIGAWLERWWVEAALGVVALAAAASGAVGGDAVRAGLGVVLAATLLDRIRLRLDNRSLAVAVEEVREPSASAARGSTRSGAASDGPTADAEGSDAADGDPVAVDDA